MSKGIRPAVNEMFIEMSKKRLAGEYGPIDHYLALGNRKFRRAVVDWAMVQFGITIDSAATAYNNAKIECTKLHPELVAGLGRPEDKKGGRKRKADAAPVTAAAPAATTETAQAESTTETQGTSTLGDGVQDAVIAHAEAQAAAAAAAETAETQAQTEETETAAAESTEPVAETLDDVAAAQADEAVAEQVAAQQEAPVLLFRVYKEKSGDVVKDNLTEEQAKEFIAANGYPKVGKPKLLAQLM